MYLLHAAFGMSLADVAATLGRDRSTVGRGVRQIEERREDARFDDWLSQLEACLRTAPEPQR
jgi:chromosomal replication initiation ATPase DnaA